MGQPLPPPLGAAIRAEFGLDPAFLTVNHGSYGATPLAVLEEQGRWRRALEAQPTRFMGRDYPPAARAAAGVLAGVLGAEARDVAFVENATTGCNAVLRSLRFQPDDEIVVLGHGYGAVVKTVRHIVAQTGARMVVAPSPFPRPDEGAIVAALAGALGARTRLVVLDHITSHSALVLPLARMVAACREAGAPVLVDGAHGPGQVPLDVAALGADYYVGNCHKWLMAPKGAGFLWAAPARQAGLHPVTISHGYGQGFLPEFDWIGTRDPSSWLAVPAAIAFFDRLGGAALMRRNAALAREATAFLVDALGTEPGAEAAQMAAMGLVRLPLAGHVDEARALALRERLLDAGTDAPVNAIDGAAWMRISAQAYNEMADFERLAGLVRQVCAASSP